MTRGRVVLAGLMATAILGMPALPPAVTGSTSSAARDAGQDITLDVPGRVDGTPWIAASGDVVAVAWGASASGGADVYAAVSRDGGTSFAAPVKVNRIALEGRLGGELPPRVSVHAPASGTPEVSVLYSARSAGVTTIKIARSRDGGRTFDIPVALQSAGAAGDRGWPALALDRRGTPHAVWLDHRGQAASKTASHHHGAASKGAPADGVAFAQKSAIFYGRPGATTETSITTGVCYCCKTTLATGPDDTLVAAWRHVYAGDYRDIAVSVSRDGGRTFSAPVRVAEDGWSIAGCPDDGPSAVVDAQGITHLVWPTVLAGETPQGALFYASSRDGRTFTPRVRIPTLGSPKPTYPQIASVNGRLVVSWEERQDGRTVSVVRSITPDGASARFGAPVIIGGTAGDARHAAIAGSSRGLVAAWATGGEASTIRVARVTMP